MSAEPALYQVPMTLGRGKQWATKCRICDTEIRMGPGSKAAMLRLLSVAGRLCADCRVVRTAEGPISADSICGRAARANKPTGRCAHCSEPIHPCPLERNKWDHTGTAMRTCHDGVHYATPTLS